MRKRAESVLVKTQQEKRIILRLRGKKSLNAFRLEKRRQEYGDRALRLRKAAVKEKADVAPAFPFQLMQERTLMQVEERRMGQVAVVRSNAQSIARMGKQDLVISHKQQPQKMMETSSCSARRMTPITIKWAG